MHILYVCVPSTSSERPRWCSTMVLGRVGWEYGGDSPAHARCTELRALGVWWCIQLSANCSTQCTVQHRVAEVAGTMARNWLESLPALRSRPGLYDLIRRGEGARERDEQKCNGGYGSMSGYSLPPLFPLSTLLFPYLASFSLHVVHDASTYWPTSQTRHLCSKLRYWLQLSYITFNVHSKVPTCPRSTEVYASQALGLMYVTRVFRIIESYISYFGACIYIYE